MYPFTAKRALFLGGMIALFCSFASAHAATTEEKLKSALQSAFPGMSVESIQPTSLPGLYEVTAGGTIFYSDATAQHVVYGDMLSIKGQNNVVNLTEEKRKQTRLALLKTIPEKTMIIYPANKPRYQVTVFTDIDCGYCRKFHQDIPELNRQGVTVRYIAFPREGKKSATYNKMVSIWCSADKQTALNEAKKGGNVTAGSCNHPIDDHMRIVQKLELHGTPTMILSNGTILPGYLPPATLLEQLRKADADL